jgi:hypothetical protein
MKLYVRATDGLLAGTLPDHLDPGKYVGLAWPTFVHFEVDANFKIATDRQTYLDLDSLPDQPSNKDIETHTHDVPQACQKQAELREARGKEVLAFQELLKLSGKLKAVQCVGEDLRAKAAQTSSVYLRAKLIEQAQIAEAKAGIEAPVLIAAVEAKQAELDAERAKPLVVAKPLVIAGAKRRGNS